MNWDALGIEFRQGGQHKVYCPQCQQMGKKRDTSLSVDYDRGLYNCHKCGWSGSAQNQQKAVQNPIRHKDQGQYSPAQLKDLTEAAIDFFKKRGISERVLRLEGVKCSIKWMPQSKQEALAIAFPFIKDNMRVNTKYRDPSKNMSQDKGGEKCFYRWDKLKGAKNIYIVEGEMDALTLVECGYDEGVTSVPDGAPNPTANSLETKFSYFNEESQLIFEEAEKVYLVVDNDTNGQFLENELARRIGKEKCFRVNYPEGCKDINEVLVKYGKDSVKDILINAHPYPITGIHKFRDYRDDILNYYDNGDEEGVSTGWLNMDNHFKLFKGHLNVLTGIPNSGKSEWLDDMMMNTIKNNNWRWAIYSPENLPAKMHFQKLIEKCCNKSMTYEGDKIDRETLVEEIEHLSEMIDLVIPEENEMTLDDILAKIKSSVFRTGIDGFIIDPWNEIEHELKSGQTETDYVSLSLAKIRRFARRHDLSAWIVAHPAKLYKDKSGEYPVPTLYDISGSANWRNKADNGFVVWRDFQGDQITKVYIQKIRFKNTGKLGEVGFRWDWKTGNYHPLTFNDATTDEQLNSYEKGGF